MGSRYYRVISKMIIQGPLKLSGIFKNMVLIYQHVNVYGKVKISCAELSTMQYRNMGDSRHYSVQT